MRCVRWGVKPVIMSGFMAIFMSPAWAAQLLVADLESVGVFELKAENRDDVVGGEIRLADKAWTINKISVHSLIGASSSKNASSGDLEFVVFSSSFSAQTSEGRPWVAAKNYQKCDQPYNSFLAVYTVTDSTKQEVLSAIPYLALTDNVDSSDKSTVYCFISKPPVSGELKE